MESSQSHSFSVSQSASQHCSVVRLGWKHSVSALKPLRGPTAKAIGSNMRCRPPSLRAFFFAFQFLAKVIWGVPPWYRRISFLFLATPQQRAYGCVATWLIWFLLKHFGGLPPRHRCINFSASIYPTAAYLQLRHNVAYLIFIKLIWGFTPNVSGFCF